MKNRKKFTGVFQVSFDIAESSEVTEQDRLDLAEEINHLISNYSDINGKPLGFMCINGIYTFEDMMGGIYTQDNLDELTKMSNG